MSGQRILVTGDFVLDHHIYEGQRHHYGEPAQHGVKVFQQLGGAALVADILTELLRDPDATGSTPVQTDRAPAPPSSAYAFWRPFPRKESRDRQFWRVSDAMGFGGEAADPTPAKTTGADVSAGEPRVVVIAEGGMGFRTAEEAWPKKQLVAAKWIVFKTTAPAAEGPLWEYLTNDHQDRLVVVIAAQELRKSQARLSTGLSWEQTVENLLVELQTGRALSALTRCRHLIVSFESEGVVWLDLAGATKGERLGQATRVHFVHDAPVIEGERAHAVQGTTFGLQSCIAAAVAWQLARDEADLPAALEAGLAGTRDLREQGHGPALETPSGFPAARLARVLKNPPYVYSRAVFAAGTPLAQRSWGLLRESLGRKEPAFDLARLVLLRGPIALASLPHLRIGNLLTADRHEMESLRTLVQVIRRYQRHDPGKKPLSLTVFGPPGAGKSFAVRELANQIIDDAGWLEFNLSQFSGPDDLIGSFHQIRDQVLQGKLPVAFFDEFDAHNYKWLAPLLAPMQDGKFQDGQITHTLGKCVFVFAGGTSWTFETFGPPVPPPGAKDESAGWRDFRLAKGPDFKSRIDGYLNVVGPNRRPMIAPATADDAQKTWVGGHPLVPDPDDVCFPIRRALMIRSELRCQPHEKLDLDEGLVHALLRAESYTHGARSLGKILQPFIATRPGALRRSFLLPHAQLGMHVDADAFIALCGEARSTRATVRLSDQQIETIAVAIHETFRALGRQRGWLKPGSKSDKDFADLSDFLKDSNRAAAERLLDNLQLVGWHLAIGPATADEEQGVRDRIEYVLETLAEAEHDGWSDWHLSQGWQWDPKRDDDKRLHPCLRPYVALPKVEVDKDRDTVRHYPDFARMAGMKIVCVDSQP
jgi:hypothetical protein